MTRVLTSLLLIPLIIALVLWGPPLLVFIAVAIVAGLCYDEYRVISAGYGIRLMGLGFAAGMALLAVGEHGEQVVTALALAALAVSMRSHELDLVLPRAASLVLGVAYVFGSWKCAILLYGINPHWLLFALAINWIGDISAFYVGRSFGRHKMAPRVSPGKSWEGAAASAIASIAFGAIYLPRFVPAVRLPEAIVLSVVVSVAGQLGDLAESALKRGAGIKDSGSLLPGHGGWLDRVDSSMFAMPAVYLYLKII